MSRKLATENYLDKIPVHKDGLNWTVDENGEITLEVENRGVANKLAQILLKRPKVSFIHLDEMGNFIWPLLDGETDIITLGEKVKEKLKKCIQMLHITVLVI